MLEDYNQKYLTGELTEDNIDPLIELLLEINLEKKQPKYFKLILNSDGGDLQPALALIDVIESLKFPVHTIGIGEVQSAALMILMSGAKGHRSVTKNTSLMSHQCIHPPIEGKGSEYIAYMKAIDISTRVLIDHYMQHTGLSEEIIQAKLLNAGDVYLTPQEALEFNIIDSIGGGL